MGMLSRLAVVAVALCLLPVSVFSAEGPNTAEKDSAAAQAKAEEGVSRLTLAGKIAEYGRAENNPLALLVAAQIIKATPATDASMAKAADAQSAEGDAAQKKGALDTADSLLSEAKTMAAGDAQLVAVIEAEGQKTGTRGDVTGPNKHKDRVRAHHTDVYRITFKGHERAKVAVVGDGDNDLDLFVYDEGGHLIASDEDGTDKCYVEWTPRRTGEFTIKIKNLGNVYSDYLLLTN